MAASWQEIETGAEAMKDYVASINWEGNFLPWVDYENGARQVINTWDSFVREVVPVDRVVACGRQLFQDISAAGYGSQVTEGQCIAAAHAVLIAVGRTRG